MEQQEAVAPIAPPVQKAARKTRAEELQAFMQANSIQFKDVVPVQYKAVVLSAEMAKVLNPRLTEKSVEELNAGTEENLTMYRLCQRPSGATVQSREYNYELETTTFLDMESLKPAFLFEGEAAVHNAFLNGGPTTLITGVSTRKPAAEDRRRWEWDRMQLLLGVSIAVHRAAQDYCVDIQRTPQLPFTIADLFDKDAIEAANAYLDALMGGELNEQWLFLGAVEVRAAFPPPQARRQLVQSSCAVPRPCP